MTGQIQEAYVSFIQPVNVATATSLLTHCLQLRDAGAKRIHLGLGSGGGSLTAGFSAYNQLRAMNIDFVTYNLGEVSSVALLWYVLGKRRVACVTSCFLFHGTNWTFSSQTVPFNNLADAYNTLLNQQAALYKEVAEASGLAQDKINGWALSSRNLSSGDSVVEKFAHEIGEFSIPSGVPWVQIG